jgi:hypothetical protein
MTKHSKHSNHSNSEENTGQEKADDDDDESQTSSASPTPVRQKELRNSARRAAADSIDQRRLSTNHLSNKRLLGDAAPIGPPIAAFNP